MKKLAKSITAIALVASVGLGLTGCYTNDEYQERKALQNEYDTSNSTELTNLKEKRAREDDPSAIRYLYLMNFGQIVGYYVTKGKISSNGSQISPEQEVIRYYGEPNILDSAQDDGSYGASDPGIFFFTSDGVMVVTSLDYIQSDAPLAIDVPRLGGSE